MAASVARPWIAILLLSLCSCLLLVAESANETAHLPPNYVVVTPKKFGGKRTLVLTCTNPAKKNSGCSATCPARCPNRCIAICPTCTTFCVCDIIPGTVCGDPRFTGADGNVFYFHGRKDQEFCLVSDSDLHINAHFIGKRNPDKNRDFTWVQALGILFGENHQLYIGAEKTVTWNDDVDHLIITFDNESVIIPAELNARWVSVSVPALSITRTSVTNGVIVELNGVFTIMASAVPITEEDSKIHSYGVTPYDSLAHLDLSFKFHSLTDNVHGVLGQTYRPDYVNKFDVTNKMPVMGGAPNFLSSGIFSTDCAVARFGHETKAEIAMVTGTNDH